MPPKGRPPKKRRNISGLKNQPAQSNTPLESIIKSNTPDPDGDSCENDDEPIPHDAKDRASSEQEDNDEEDSELESDSDAEWKGLTSRELGQWLADLACRIDDDAADKDWVPSKFCKVKKCKRHNM